MHSSNLLKYHQAVFDRLGVQPIISPERQAQIAQREALCNIHLPASIKELFAIEGIEKLLYDHTSHDLVDHDQLGNPADVAHGYLQVMLENQGVIGWYVQLDGSDDPPVWNNNEAWNKPLTAIPWEFNGSSFSSFIFDVVSGHSAGLVNPTHWYGACHLAAHLSAHDQAPELSVLDELRLLYHEGPHTLLPEAQVYRFYSGHGYLFIRSVTEEDIATSKAEWYVEANTADELYELAKDIWRYYTLAKTIEPQAWGPGWREARAAYERLKSSFSGG